MRTDIDICTCGHLRSEHLLETEGCLECTDPDCIRFEFDTEHPDNDCS